MTIKRDACGQCIFVILIALVLKGMCVAEDRDYEYWFTTSVGRELTDDWGLRFCEKLTWTDNATGEQGFIIERSVNGGAFGDPVTLGPDTTVYDDNSCTPNNWYGYRVRAYNGTVHSAFSNESHDLSN